MLSNKQIIWQVKRKAKRNVYIDTNELADLIRNLRPTELSLYNHLMGMVITNPTIEDFSTKALAYALGTSEGTIKKARATLTTLGYLVIKKFKDERGLSVVRVVIGKDQVELYNLGLNVEIRDASKYRELCEMFNLLDPQIPDSLRAERVKEANTYYLENHA